MVPDPHRAQVPGQTIEITGKWIGEAVPHLPSGITDIDGKTPRGPAAVAALDPYRVVAVIDGKQIVAGFAAKLIGRVPPSPRNGYVGGLPQLLQQLYAQMGVATEAARERLDLVEPWRSKLQRLGRDAGRDLSNAAHYVGDPNVPPSMVAQWQDTRMRIYWDAYLSRAPSWAERTQLLAKIQQKYRVKVIDPDFFH
jgi:hypothetical protein